MSKVLVLQSLYTLSDEQAEYQIKDRFSFMRFAGLELYHGVPDAKTIWHYREKLRKTNLIEKIFHGLICVCICLCHKGQSRSAQ